MILKGFLRKITQKFCFKAKILHNSKNYCNFAPEIELTMAYKSIDELQKTLGGTVFKHTKDAKKAAGRALGTMIEIITFYLINYWRLTFNTSIERGLAEYGNPEITHNVEFSLHPILKIEKVSIKKELKNITAQHIVSKLNLPEDFTIKKNILLDTNGTCKNACVIAESEEEIVLAFLHKITKEQIEINIVWQSQSPFAMFECKRVGVEEGNKKGPQTIEKAKQGAYVAKMTSSLQKIRTDEGERYGLLYEEGKAIIKPYFELLDDVINHREQIPENFILSIGVVSNHGNWFTQEDQNKELKVLAQSYDWLLFLTDEGLAQFITDLLLKPKKEYAPVRKAFLESYKEGKKQNTFTKVKINMEAHLALVEYFHKNAMEIQNWFNIISPVNGSLSMLQSDLNSLTIKANKI